MTSPSADRRERMAMDRAVEDHRRSQDSAHSTEQHPSEDEMLAAILKGRDFMSDAHRNAAIAFLKKGNPGSTPMPGSLIPARKVDTRR